MNDTLIQKSNEAYYGTEEAILTDTEFDLLSEHGLDQDSRNFRTKVKHAIPMGSLAKIKTANEFSSWLKKFPGYILVAMPKLDGCSIALSYRQGSLDRAVTRGDGTYGNLITENIMQTQVITGLVGPNLEARGEALIHKGYAKDYDKNLRNICSGMLNAKDPREDLAKVRVVLFDVHGDCWQTWNQKKAFFSYLTNTVPYVEFQVHNTDTIYDSLKRLYDAWATNYEFKIDGLVIQAIKDPDAPLPPLELMPTDKVALKFQDASVTAVIDRIEWYQGKHGKLAPVVILANGGVEIDSTRVQRISASNYALMRFVGLGVGAQIQVIKANQIIPYISAVDKPSLREIDVLPICPDCGTQSIFNATQVDAICPNHDCPGKVLVTLQKQIELFDIDFISEATIEKLVDAGYDTLEKIFRLTVEELVVLDGFGLTSARYLVNALQHASLTEAKVFKAAGLKQLGARKGAMLLDHYGSLDNLILSVMERGLDDIPNFGDIQKGLIEDNLGAIVEIQKRFRALNIIILPHKKETVAMQVCMTGTCPGIPRADLENMLKARNIKSLDSVTKDCSLLICEDPNGNSSKLQKARKLGVKIQSYKDFLASI